MTAEKPSRRSRALNFVLFRLIPLVLIVAIVIVGFQVLQALIGRVNEQTTITQRQPDFAATATAIAPAEQGASLMLAGYRPEQAQQFATNTPQAPVETPAPANEVAPTLPPVTPRALPTLFTFGDAGGQAAGGTAVPSPVPQLDRQGNDLVNVVLMGNDSEITGDTVARSDSMIIVSINRTAGTVSMLSLPRDLYVYIPGWTMQRINNAYVHGEAVGWTDGGFGLLRQTLFYNFGINVHYFATVDITGFKTIVDALGGVDIAVDCALQDLPLIEAEVPEGAYRINEDGEYVLPVGYYTMSGAEALWYARSRGNSDDFDRGRRQQQILRAAWRKARDTGLLNNVVQLWNEGIQYVDTNMTLEDIIGLVPLALSLDPASIENFRLVRTYHTTPWQPPDGSYVQLPVYDTIRPLLEDFYTPPTASRLANEVTTVRVLNGTTNDQWDWVAADTLGWRGINAIAGGSAPETNHEQTILIDYAGGSKGSSRDMIARALNIQPDNIQIQPDPNRTVDFEVILGSNYNSCTTQGILPVEG